MITLYKSVLRLITISAIALLGSPLYGADLCTGVIGNLAGSNCGFDNGTVGWTNSAERIEIVNGATPGGFPSLSLSKNPGIPFPSYSSRSPEFSVISGLTYNVSIYTRLTGTANLSFGLVTPSGTIAFNPVSTPDPDNSTWLRWTGSFNAGETGNYRLGIFLNNISQSGSTSLGIDSLVVTVPEPASIILLSSLCSAAIGYARKRRVI